MKKLCAFALALLLCGGLFPALVAGLDYGPFHFTSNHASNYLPLKGTLPDDREKFLSMIDSALGGKSKIRSEIYRAL